MGEQVEVDIIANDKASPAWKQQADMVHKYVSELARLDSTQKANEQSARAYDKAARQAIEAGRTPLERYNAKVGELKGLLDKNKLSQEQYARAVAMTAKELDGATEQAAGFGMQALKILGTVGGIGGALKTALDFQKELTQEATRTTLEIGKQTRAYQVQASLKDLEGRVATGKIIDIAENNAVDIRSAQDVSKQLVSSGFNAPESTGATDVMFKILASNNLDESKGEDITKAAGQFMVAFGMDKNDPKNLLDLGVRTRGLFKNSDTQLGDMGAFAQAAPSFANAGVNLEDTLSTLAILREAEDAGQGATHGRNIVGLMTTFAKEDKKVEELKKLGVKPGDLDLTGETLKQALGTLKKSMSGLNDAERSGTLKTLFGQENVTGASILLGGLDKFQRFGEYQRDEAGFEAGVRVNQSGPNAQLKRLEVRKARESLKYQDQLAKDELLRAEFRRSDEEYGLDAKSMGPAGFFYNATIAGGARVRDAALYTGLVTPSGIASRENIANIERGATSNFSLDALKSALEANTAATQLNAAAVAKNTDETTKPKKFVQATDPTPARPVPAAALGSAR